MAPSPVGWTILDNLYAVNGTFFIVTDEPDSFPERRMMVGSGYVVKNGAEEVAKREPTDKDMRVISTKEARRLFGTFANRLDGVTVSAQESSVLYRCALSDLFASSRQLLNNDPEQCT